MKIPEKLNDPNTWGATKVGSVAFVDGGVWRKTVDGWVPYTTAGSSMLEEHKLQGAPK